MAENKISHDELVRAVASESGVSQAQTRKVLRGLSEVVSTELEEGKQVGIPGLGSWQTTKRKSHYGKAQGKQTVIHGHLRVRWNTSTPLRRRLNPQLYVRKNKKPKK